MPPVKLACLSCRNARIRCDGACPCYNCLSREQACLYRPSRRGGARTRVSNNNKQPTEELATSRDFEKQYGQLEHLLSPGAGLKQPNLLLDYSSMPQPSASCVLRAYSDNESLLNAYYIYIHPFFPVLPPPAASITTDTSVAWCPGPELDLPLRDQSSPLSLALSAVLVLIRPPEDMSLDNQVFADLRARVAQSLAKRALDQVEADADMCNYQVFRDSAFMTEGTQAARLPFHPSVPIELESIITLLIVGNYEHMQRANLVKMASRVSQALVLAKSLSLHRQPQISDEYAEARRRVWWMTYAHGQLCAIVCHDVFAGVGVDSEITTPYPRFGTNNEVWSSYIAALRLSGLTVAFVNTQKALMKRGISTPGIYQDMAKLDADVNQVQSRLDLEVNGLSHGLEAVPARVLGRLTRIKLASSKIRIHRQNAYSGIPLFVRDTCDMVLPHHADSSDMDEVSYKTPVSSVSDEFAGSMFDHGHSAEICTDAALSITRQLRQLSNISCPSLLSYLPCTMPSSTCCAMQASYALLMQLCSVRVMARSLAGDALGSDSSERLEEELKHGLEAIIATLGYHSETYDAIRGMRDEVRSALQEAG